METTAQEQTELLPSLLGSGKDEMNFAEFPIAMLTDRVPKGKKSIKFEDQVFDARRKRMINRKRVIEGSEEYGLPTATDDTVILALIQLTKLRSDFAQRDVTFTRRELIEMLGWPDDGQSYRRIKLSLIRISSVNYIYDNAWWDNRQKCWTTKTFHILESVEINDSRTVGEQGSLFPSRIVWSEVVFESFGAGFLRDIDFDVCKRIEHPIALRMYRLLGKRFYHKPEWLFDLKDFAQNQIGLGDKYEGNAHLARKLEPAIQELETIGFLIPMSHAERFPKKGREWLVKFVQKLPGLNPPAMEPVEAEPDRPKADIPASVIAQALRDRGVSQKATRELTAAFSEDAIQTQIEAFDWLIAKNEKKSAGYLCKSILEEYSLPKGFKPKAQIAKEAEAKEQAKIKAEEDRRKKTDAVAHEAEKQKRINAYWDNLSQDEQTTLVELAIKEADSPPPSINGNDQMTTSIRNIWIKTIRQNYIEKLLSIES